MPYASRDDHNACQRRCYKKNPAPHKARTRAYAAAHREQVVEYFRRYNRKRREQKLADQRARQAGRAAFRFGGRGPVAE